VSSLARTILSTLLLALVTTTQLVAPPPAAAEVTTLCRGYTGCGQAGMSDAGYGRASGAMYWRMYAGHNCTNYAAFRVIQNGMPNVRPWEGSGNATYWGTSMASITDNVPTVGSIAWWRAGVYPAGSAGHVAYVERVVDADTIIVSQDSWGGDFSWAKVTRGSRGWPSGFIHFNDASLTNLSRPTLSGTPKVGSTLTATAGTWSPTADVAYQWRAGGADLPGATKPTFTITEDQLGQRVRVRVTASKPGYPSATARSPRSRRVEPGKLTSTAAPGITGEPVVDGTLTAGPGSWDPMPDTLSFQWLADGVPIKGAVGEQLTPAPALVGSALAVRVTASRSGFTDVSMTSPATLPVVEAALAPATAPVVMGVPRLGEVLEVTTGATTPAGSPTVEWLRDGQLVAAATGPTYELGSDDLGARISARVRWERPGYVPLETESTSTAVVKAAPDLALDLRPGSGQLRVRADVLAAPGAVLPEELRIRVGRTRVSVPLADGTVTTVLTGLRPGERTVRVVVPATRTSARSAVVDAVAIL
jgi:surface antigen